MPYNERRNKCKRDCDCDRCSSCVPCTPCQTQAISVIKTTVPPTENTFNFTVSPAVESVLAFSITTGPGGTGAYNFPFACPRDYTITELPQAGWSGTSSQNITVKTGEIAIAQFLNRQSSTIVVQKNILDYNDNDRSFNYVITPTAGSISGAVITTSSGTGSVTITGALPGVYAVTELGVSGWTGSGVVNVTASVGTTGVAVFNNVQFGTLTIQKEVTGGSGTFSFDYSGTGSAGSSSGTTAFFAGSGGTATTVIDLYPGIYDVNEAFTPGWTTTTSGYTGVQVFSGADTIVTFTNAKNGDIVVNKLITTGPDQDFEFTIVPDVQGTSNFTITTTDGTGSFLLTDVPPGDYTITETVPPGWIVDTNPLLVSVAPGGTGTVSFENSTLAILNIEKTTVGGTGSFDFSYSGPDSGNATINVTGTTGAVAIEGLQPGTYTVTETVPSGWSVDVNPGSVTISAGTSGTVSFTNTKLSILNIEKTIVDGGDPGSFDFLFSGPSGGTVTIAVAGTTGAAQVANLPPGTYDVTEVVPPGWFLTTTGTVSVTLAPGASGTASFSNVQAGTLTIQKGVTGGTDFFVFNYAGTGSYGGSSGTAGFNVDVGGASTTVTGLYPGVYTVTEQSNASWTSTPTGYTGVQIVTGTDTIVTFNNEKNADITFAKTIEPYTGNNGTFDFTLSPGAGALGTTGFSITTAGGAGNYIINNVAPGNYTLTEITQPYWYALTPINFTVDPGTPLTIPIVNQQYAILNVEKTVLGGTGVFNFDFTSPTGNSGSATITVTGTTGVAIITDLAPNVYTVTETVPSGWVVYDNPLSVTLAPGTSGTVSFTNSALATLVIEKTTVGGEDPFTFNFAYTSATGDSGFSTVLVTGNTGSAVIAGIIPGDYTVTETVPIGWNVDVNPIVVTVPPGGTGTASFTNIAAGEGALIINKTVTGVLPESSDGTFDFSYVSLGASGTASVATVGLTGSTTILNVPAGNYVVTETGATGWFAGYIGVGATASAVITAGGTATVNFSNEPLSTLAIGKRVIPETSEGTFTIDYAGTGSVAGVSGSVTISASGPDAIYAAPIIIPSGTYILTEQGPPPGWSVFANPITLFIDIGDQVSQPFTNTAVGALTINKTVTGLAEGADGTFDFSYVSPGASGTASVTTVGLTGSTTILNVPIDTYVVTETGATGWPAGYVGVGATASAVVTQGGTATVNFSNEPLAQLAIGKQVLNNSIGTFIIDYAGTGAVAGITGSVSIGASGPAPVFAAPLNLPPGSYILTEQGQTGWSVTGGTNPRSVTLAAGDAVSEVFVNTPVLNGINFVKNVAGPDGTFIIGYQGIGGAAAATGTISVVTSGGIGSAPVSNLPWGDYLITETPPPGYTVLSILPNPVTITSTGGAGTVNVTNAFTG